MSTRLWLRAPVSPTLRVTVWLSDDRDLTRDELVTLIKYLEMKQRHEKKRAGRGR